MSTTKKKSWEVIKSTREKLVGIGVNGKALKFDKNGMFVTHDAGLAKDIKQMYGQESNVRDVIVMEVDDSHPSYEQGSDGRRTRKMFLVNAPWKKEK